MISEFLASWPLFHNSYLGGWFLAVLLALLGVQLVARDQVFLGAAVAQASTLGISLALITAAWRPFGLPLHSAEWYPRVWALCCSIAAALAIEGVAGRRESREAVTGFIFLLGSAGSMLLVAHSPFGLEEVQRLLASSLIGATPLHVAVFALLVAAAAGGVVCHGERMLLMAIDPATAAAMGLAVRRWSIGLAVGFALAVGLSIRVAGLLYTFGGLILPVLAAKQIVREMRMLYVLAPALGLACSTAGFILAHAWDVPPAQLTVVWECALLAALWLMRATTGRARRRRRAVR